MHFPLLLASSAILTLGVANAQLNAARSGNYWISYCGTGPGSKADQLLRLLPTFADDLRQVIADVDMGIRSKAYRAFFKTDQNAAAVRQVFQSMLDGAKVTLPPEADETVPAPTDPVIMCLDPSMPYYPRFQQICANPPAAMIGETSTAIFCPKFWDDMGDGPLFFQCPIVSVNQFYPNDQLVMYNKFGAFVHEFAHAYLGIWDPDEVYNVQDAVDLDAEASRRNPQSYALYASSR
ncbi:MAG: hypothetical protein Q9220_005511 [cf. Caloplaca sp. 1 TL-2023]